MYSTPCRTPAPWEVPRAGRQCSISQPAWLNVYLVLGFICAVLSEWIAGMLAMRAKVLESSIRNLLNDPARTGLAQQLFNYPVISRLAPQGKVPSYIPARLFATALLDTIAPATGASPQPFENVQ